MTDLTAADFADSLAEAERHVAVADARAATAGSVDERAIARAEGLAARRGLIRGRGIDLLERGRLILGLPLVVALDDWLRDRAEELGPEALDALAAALKAMRGESP